MQRITSPDDPALSELCEKLTQLADETDQKNLWPAKQLQLCGQGGVFEWFLPTELGGQGWCEVDVIRGYLALSSACLTTTFVITQRTGACRRIATSDNLTLRDQLLPDLIAGQTFGTVGISHLTTSGRHLRRPALTAVRVENGYRLNGGAPWVTGGVAADTVVVGATVVESDADNLEWDQEELLPELLVAVPTKLAGVEAQPAFDLVGVSASKTGAVRMTDVLIDDHHVIAGPMNEIVKSGSGGRTGGHQTSTLAIGLADSALGYLADQATRRADLIPAADTLLEEHTRLKDDLLAIAAGEPACSNEELRQRANSLVLRATQAALAAAKGAGYVSGHPVGRWCREALFFMVWSCPQPVMSANLCEFAGIQE